MKVRRREPHAIRSIELFRKDSDMPDIVVYYAARLEAQLVAGKEIGHEGVVRSRVPETDWAECSCGWKSTTYYDGAEYAWGDYLRHIRANGAVIKYAEED